MIIMTGFRISFVKFYFAQFKTDTQQNNYLISTVLLFSRALKHTYTHPTEAHGAGGGYNWGGSKLQLLYGSRSAYVVLKWDRCQPPGNLENISLVLFHPTHYISL